MKRVFDLLFSTIALLVFIPIGLIISILIVLESRGGVFYFQERIGKNEKPFLLYKFRTMKTGASREGKLTVGMKDTRITKVGYYLRKFKIDEFPQFLNVLKGEMSIVGPRPEVAEYVRLYTAEQRKILNVKPGITDYASIEYFDENRLLGESENPQETYVQEIMPRKIDLNQKYLQNPGVGTDLKIIFLTVRRMLFK